MGGGTVADGDDADAVFFDQLLTFFLGRPHFILRRRGIDHCRIQYLAGNADYGQFAAGAIGGIQAEDDGVFYRRLHQKLLQVDAKYSDGLLRGFFGKRVADFPLQRRENQPGKSVKSGVTHKIRTGGVFFDKIADDRFAASIQIHLQRNL